jgi:hypothetical protein
MTRSKLEGTKSLFMFHSYGRFRIGVKTLIKNQVFAVVINFFIFVSSIVLAMQNPLND